MKVMFETKLQDKSIYNEYSLQEWIDFNSAIPSVFLSTNIKGDYYGSYVCIVERPYRIKKDSLSTNKTFSNMTSQSIENCYWNNLANKFQDKDGEWVEVIAWMPLPQMFKHKLHTISKEEIINKIESGEFELIDKDQEKRHKEISGMWSAIKNSALHFVSLKEEVYISSETVDGFEECIWAKRKV